jgi:hypothetical protein
MLACRGAGAQTGYQAEPIAPDPALKSVQIPESVLMRAAYEARHRDCPDAAKHLDAVQLERPRWAPVFAVRLLCARSEANAPEERAALNALTALQAGNWVWWRDSAQRHAKDVEPSAAVSDLGRAIVLRPWDGALYAQRSEWREQLRDYNGAYSDAARQHVLEPERGAPLERMARLADRAGRPAGEAQQDHALAELNPEQLPFATRDDSDLPVAKMSLQELLLRAGYALRTSRNDLARELVQAALTRRPDTAAALEMIYQLWKRGVVGEDQARAAVNALVKLNGQRADYYRWLLEMGASDAEKLGLDRAIIAVEPYEAKNYADLAALELTFETRHGAMEPSLPTNIPWPPTVTPAPAIRPGPPAPVRPPNAAARQAVAARTRAAAGAAGADGQAAGSAEGDYRLAINLDPSEPAYYFGLAQALDKRSAFPLEMMALNMALIGDPGNQDYQAARAKLP